LRARKVETLFDNRNTNCQQILLTNCVKLIDHIHRAHLGNSLSANSSLHSRS